MIRVYIDMAADLFHIGHLNLIRRAKQLGDYLIVGIHSDKDIESYKRMPVINEKERYEIIKSCKYVDEVVENAPLNISMEFIKKNKIDIVAHGDNLSPAIRQQHTVPMKLGIMRYLPSTKGISTTEIISEIQKRAAKTGNPRNI